MTEQPPDDGNRPLLLFADLLRACGPAYGEGSGPDQGERVFLRELGSRLAMRGPTLVYSSLEERTAGFVQEVPANPVISRKLATEIWRRHPRAIVYVYPVTTASLVRARLLKLVGRGAPTVLLGLATHPLGRAGRVLRRFLWPDLLLSSSIADNRALRALGARADLLPMGVDVRRFRPPGPGEKLELRRRWGLPLEEKIVLHVGHAVSARNLQVLEVLANRPGITPVVLISHVREAGSDQLIEEMRQKGVVVLEGYQPHVEELYRAADCYVFPSSSWGGGIDMPLSVLEAMATDLPVASTFFGALPASFADAEGIRFAASDHELIEAVEELLRLQPETRHLVVERYSWDAVADRLLSLLPAGA